MLSDEEEALLRPALSLLEQNFPDFALAVLSNEGKLLHYDYSNWRIGRMLFRDSLEDMDRDLSVSEEMEEWADFEDMEDYDDE